MPIFVAVLKDFKPPSSSSCSNSQAPPPSKINYEPRVYYLIFLYLSDAEVEISQPIEVKPSEESLVRRGSRRAKMMKELDGIKEDNAAKTERDRTTLWRKIQKYMSRNDDIAKE